MQETSTSRGRARKRRLPSSPSRSRSPSPSRGHGRDSASRHRRKHVRMKPRTTDEEVPDILEPPLKLRREDTLRGRRRKRNSSRLGNRASPRTPSSRSRSRSRSQTSPMHLDKPLGHIGIRRRSDASPDHNLRGRARRRKGSGASVIREDSQTMSTEESKNNSRHGSILKERSQEKRKRSPPPSRPRSKSPPFRRQHSLPNIYKAYGRPKESLEVPSTEQDTAKT